MRRDWSRRVAATALTFGLSALGGTAWAAADLMPVTGSLANSGQVGVINLGDSASGPTQLSVNCQKLGGGACPESPGMAGYENPAYPNAATVQVPALAPGQSFNHELGFWDDLVWAPGSYQLVVLVDAGDATAESNEANNIAAVIKEQPLSSVGTPVPKGPGGFAQASPQAGGAQIEHHRLRATGDLAAALPDIIPTPLGFVMKGGPVAWGQSVVLDKPDAADAIRQGPQQNLCRFQPAAYRTYNKGQGNAGSFVTKVYRDSHLIETQTVPEGLPAKSFVDWHQFPILLHEGLNLVRVVFDAQKQVTESDEQNTYMIRVTVKIDCDGDGTAGGPSHGINGLTAPMEKPQARPEGQPGVLVKPKVEQAPQRLVPRQ